MVNARTAIPFLYERPIGLRLVCAADRIPSHTVKIWRKMAQP
jgi:hypothetical protein